MQLSEFVCAVGFLRTRQPDEEECAVPEREVSDYNIQTYLEVVEREELLESYS